MRHVVLLLPLLVSCGASRSLEVSDLESQVDALFSRYDNDTPGVAITISQGGSVVLSKGYGAANLEHGILIDDETVFHAASVSKQFTAFAIYLLEADGKLNLDDDIRRYLPELPSYKETIRVRH